MAINLSDLGIGGELVHEQVYLLRVKSVYAVTSQSSGNLRLKVVAQVAEGPAMGNDVEFPGYMFGLGGSAITANDRIRKYINTAQQLARVGGGGHQNWGSLPTEPGEVTESMTNLLGSLFEAQVIYQPATDEWRDKWLINDKAVIRPVDESELTEDWSGFFPEDQGEEVLEY
jgi:hypothetical protein